ncbi:hypothetical protein C2E20_1966 [Micractinium conductrix]|uniref:Uncharacterized protein n=1 Tax=Micractinium conductrix TaxID=554055 RepID=A0A2P6VM56_9CHLO|nr:hypothetical protein C2E20_1966 [Micractinium conductrix]|eukprot:PSC75186.1 hypothetical protein C2E20_1966 [Micractinium conductrix]
MTGGVVQQAVQLAVQQMQQESAQQAAQHAQQMQQNQQQIEQMQQAGHQAAQQAAQQAQPAITRRRPAQWQEPHLGHCRGPAFSLTMAAANQLGHAALNLLAEFYEEDFGQQNTPLVERRQLFHNFVTRL